MIAYFSHKKSGCYWYRIKRPMEMMAASGVPTLKVNLNEDTDDSASAYQFYGAYPFSARKAYEYLKEEGKRIVYDMDDALGLIEKSNPNYHAVMKDIGSMEEALRYADRITVSTPKMAEYVGTLTDKPVTVIPNCYAESEWTYPRSDRGGIRIGFAGSPTHVRDLLMVVPAIENLQKKYPELVFIVMGFGNQGDYGSWYRDFRYAAPPEARKDLEALDLALSKVRFEWVPFLDFDQYPSTLINMSLDIGLCPLEDTPFNQCRSACKAMEYTLAGALALASPVGAYVDEHNSIKVSDGDWERDIGFFAENKKNLSETHAAHLEWTQAHRKIKGQFEALKEAYGQ